MMGRYKRQLGNGVIRTCEGLWTGSECDGEVKRAMGGERE